jgi:hypothetical protein
VHPILGDLGISRFLISKRRKLEPVLSLEERHTAEIVVVEVVVETSSNNSNITVEDGKVTRELATSHSGITAGVLLHPGDHEALPLAPLQELCIQV